MLRTLCFFSLCWFLCATAQAQTPDCTPKDYERLMAEAKRLAKGGEYDKAINKLQSAKTCQPQKEAEVNREVLRVFEQVNGERKRAEEQTKKAEAEARRIYANDLAYKSQVALKDGDRNTAFRLAEFAHYYVDDANPNVVQALMDALYFNDDLNHRQLRVTNLEGHASEVLSVAISVDGKQIATGSADKTAKIWDIEGHKATMILKGHTSEVLSVAFSPDGKCIATGSDDNTVKIWDLKSGNDMMTLKEHTSSICSVAFSPDGKQLASGSIDNTAKIWDLENGKVLMTFSNLSTILCVAF